MVTFPAPPDNTRLGFHYFPDTSHYREVDLQTWLPALRSLGATWVVLLAPARRAIPELFLSGLIDGGIEPVLHFPLSLADPPDNRELAVLFAAYARWGVHYAVLFDRPNSRSAWPAAGWAQSDLVERFLDRFIPLAAAASRSGLYPVFPALEPGGGYWDTAFLRASLQGLERRGQVELLERLVLSAYAPAGDHPLSWGFGGPEHWPKARPYLLPEGGEDHRSFHIFDWYTTIAQAATGQRHRILLLGVNGAPSGPAANRSDPKGPATGENEQLQRCLAVAQAAAGHLRPVYRKNTGQSGSSARQAANLALEPLPEHVLAVNYCLLAAAPGSPHAGYAWFEPDGSPRPVAEALRRWASSSLAAGAPQSSQTASASSVSAAHAAPTSQRPIAHYLLLPAYEWGVTDWHLNAMRPFVKKHRPAVGFSLQEAVHAARVTVFGGPQHFPESALDQLRAAGCIVERINGPGTSIATQLAER